MVRITGKLVPTGKVYVYSTGAKTWESISTVWERVSTSWENW